MPDAGREPDVAGEGARAAAVWQDREFARRWAGGDGLAGILALPRSIAAATVALGAPDVRLVVDVGSGPGDFLAVMLEEFPRARGLWADVSAPMRELAEDRLAPYAGRVDFAMVDMTDLSAVPRDADVITTSRASHHLSRRGLAAFYTAAAAHLAPGGWLINLDHVGPPGIWDERLRAVRRRLRPPSGGDGTGHRHEHPLPSVADHFAAFAAAGISDVAMVWREFITCLFMGRVTRA